MSRYPAATWRPVARYQPGGSAFRSSFNPRRLILHTAVSNATPSMYSFFAVNGRATSHFYVGRDGEVEQYIDTEYGSTAVLDGNSTCITVETWDGYGDTWNGSGPGPRWTDAQVTALARLAAWCHTEHDIPLVRLPSSLPGTRGIGWHRQGIDGNFEESPGQLLGGRVSGGEHWSTSAGKVCPTTTRIHQIVDEVIPQAIRYAKPAHVPIRVAFANLNQFAAKDAAHIAYLCSKADVLLLVECIDRAGVPVPVADYLPQGWAAAHDTSSSAKAGSAVAWNTAVLTAYRRPSLQLLTSEVVINGAVMVRDRYVMVQTLKVNATGEKLRFAAAHFPPDNGPAYRAAWPQGIDRIRRLRRRPLLPPLVLGCDRNDDIHEFADDVHMIASGRNIVGTLIPPKRIRVVSEEIDTYAKTQGWTDHLDVFTTLERK